MGCDLLPIAVCEPSLCVLIERERLAKDGHDVDLNNVPSPHYGTSGAVRAGGGEGLLYELNIDFAMGD